MKCRIDITGRKIWNDNDNEYGSRPSSVDISLLRDGASYKSATVSAEDKWTYTFKCLPVWQNSNQKYQYKIEETVIPDNYTSETDGYNVINTLDAVTIIVTKTWVDNDNQFDERPANITVNLLQNEQPFRSMQVITPPDEEKVEFSFEDVPVFDEDGNPFAYTVDEDDVDNYDKTVNGFDITNTSVHFNLFVAYNANSGMGSYSEYNLWYGTLYVVKTPEYVGITHPGGYAFVGWNTEDDGTGATFQPGDTIDLSESTTLYAMWEDNTRIVTGLVSPFVSDDLGLGEDFLKGFDITVELRSTFMTPAPSELKTIAVFEGSLGRFTIQNVPFGTYVLYIKRAGYLVRCMNVIISASDPDIIELTPPDGTVFDLLPGDANDDYVIEERDTMKIDGLNDVTFGDPNYDPSADLNADGIIDGSDLTIAVANINKTIMDYPGAEDVDFGR